MKKIYLIILLGLIFIPSLVLTQTDNINFSSETFKAKILNIIEEKTIIRDDGSSAIQQNIRLKGLAGTWKNKEFEYIGISEIDVISQNIYKPGEKVIVNWEKDVDGIDQFYIIQYTRDGYLYLLAIIFAIIIVIVGRGKGLRAILALIISFLVIIKFIIPQIMAGHNPLLISLIGSAFILFAIIYLTEGLNQKTHIAVISVIFSLIITFLISWLFVYLTKLTGFSSEDTAFLVGTGSGVVDFRGLLLAGILIGTLGVLDDIILGQVEAVAEIKRLNPNLSKAEIIKSGSKIGRTHLSSMVNTLFLTYAGASLPILILFNLNKTTGLDFSSAINNEVLTTEIVRTLSGSIGLALAFPIATFMATYFLKRNK